MWCMADGFVWPPGIGLLFGCNKSLKTSIGFDQYSKLMQIVYMLKAGHIIDSF